MLQWVRRNVGDLSRLVDLTISSQTLCDLPLSASCADLGMTLTSIKFCMRIQDASQT